jgi:hypothetical protein
MTTVTLPTESLGHLRPAPCMHARCRAGAGTRIQYERVFRWLCRNYTGGWDRTEALQRFIDEHPTAQVRTGNRGRIVQCLVNRHLQPKPTGPTGGAVQAPVPHARAADLHRSGGAGGGRQVQMAAAPGPHMAALPPPGTPAARGPRSAVGGMV